jgi:hypothetical protein
VGSKGEKMAISELFTKFSYRYTEVEVKSILSPLRYFKASVLLLWHKNKLAVSNPTNAIAYDLLTEYLPGNSEYLSAVGRGNYAFIFRDNLYNDLSLIRKIADSVLLLLTFFLICPVAVISKDRAKISLIMLELVETELLVEFLKKHGTKEIIIFSAFEKDILFLSLYLKSRTSIKVALLPSSNPISTLYKNVICDTFIFTAPYQKTECENLKHNWLFSSTDLWPPYSFTSIKLNRGWSEPPRHDVGIISSGMALREYLKHPSEYFKNDFQAEAEMIKGIEKMWKAGEINQPIIFLHPLERLNAEHLAFSSNYYKNIFGQDVAFSPFDEASKSNFNLCNIGISVYSSTQTERLFGGYKTLFAPMGLLKNFFPGDTFSQISLESHEHLRNTVLTLTKKTDDEFFDENNLREYRWDNYIK